MHHVEIEDFYYHDFTTISEWEVFIARLEEIMHEWKLPHIKVSSPLKPGDFVNCQWHEASEKLNFAGSCLIFDECIYDSKHYERLKLYNKQKIFNEKF